jgi:hypothetical protein
MRQRLRRAMAATEPKPLQSFLMKTFRLSPSRVIAALGFIAVMLAIIISARGASIRAHGLPMQDTHGCAPSGAVSESSSSW